MTEKSRINTRGMAISGILLAASVVTLYLQMLVPIANFTIYMISSFYVAAVIIEAGSRAGWIFYISSCVLAFAFIPDKLFLIPYALFFGVYGIIKYHIEHLSRRPLEIFLKLAFFNAALIIIAYFFKELFLGDIALPDLPGPVLVLAFEAAFLAYDYCYTLMIDFYRKRIKR